MNVTEHQMEGPCNHGNPAAALVYCIVAAFIVGIALSAAALIYLGG